MARPECCRLEGGVDGRREVGLIRILFIWRSLLSVSWVAHGCDHRASCCDDCSLWYRVDMPNVLTITKTEDLLVLKDPLAHLQNAYRQAQARGVARLQPNATPKGIIGRLDPFRRERYAKARRRWSVPANQMLQPDVYESPLQEATHLMRELAISLEAAKDDKRLGVARRVIALLQDPNILGHKLRDNITAEHLNADATIREWLGAKAAPVGAPPVERAKTEPTRSTDWFELSIAPAVSQADAAAVSRMLESGVCNWFSPGFDSIELDRLSGGCACRQDVFALAHPPHTYISL